MTPHEALDALARQTGIALAFNEQGLCRMRFDGRFVVDLETSDDETAIFLYSRLTSLPPGERGAELMTRNWTWRPGLRTCCIPNWRRSWMPSRIGAAFWTAGKGERHDGSKD